jgi:predicted DNA-binding transcriptional regulator YafY
LRGDQLARQWQLIQLLARRRYGAGLDDLADELGVVRRTVYRDLDALQFAGFPVTSEKRDGRVYYRLLDTFKLGDAPFTADEVLALAFGGDLLRALEGTVFHDSIRSALAKIRASLGPELNEFLARLSEAITVAPGPHKRYEAVRDVIRALNEAVLERRTVRIEYTTARTGKVSRRDLDPYRVWYRGGALYVIGHDHRSGEVRTFAVDRIRDPVLQEERFELPDDFDFEARTASAFGVAAGPVARVRIRFAPPLAPHVREHVWHPSQELRDQDDGGVELAMEVGAGYELRNWVLSFGADAEVLAPESLRAEVKAELARAAARYA